MHQHTHTHIYTLYNYENQLWAVFPSKIIVMSVQLRPRTRGQIAGCQIIVMRELFGGTVGRDVKIKKKIRAG